jgi:hypothetical protein
MARKNPLGYKQLLANVRAMPDGPGKNEALDHLQRLQEAGKALGQLRKAIRDGDEAEKSAQ